MRKIFWLVLMSILLVASSTFAADGDLIVNGNLGLGTTSPTDRVDVLGGFYRTINMRESTTSSVIQRTGLVMPHYLATEEPFGLILGRTNGGGDDTNEVYIGGGVSAVNSATKISFVTAPNYNTISGTERMVINSIGNVGIGTANPSNKLHVGNGTGGSGTIRLQGFSVSNSYAYITHEGDNVYIENSSSAPIDIFIQYNGNIAIGGVDPAGYKLFVNGSAYSTGGWAGSDGRWKKDIQPLKGSLEKMLKLQGVSYEWKTKEFKDRNFESGKQVGFIAQDMEKLFPELVRTDKQGYKAISYEKLTAVLVEALKEEHKKQAELEKRIRQLEGQRTKTSDMLSYANIGIFLFAGIVLTVIARRKRVKE